MLSQGADVASADAAASRGLASLGASDAASAAALFPARWLYAQLPRHYHASNGQRLSGACPPASVAVVSARATPGGLALGFCSAGGDSLEGGVIPWADLSSALRRPLRPPSTLARAWAAAAVLWPRARPPPPPSLPLERVALEPAAARALLARAGVLVVSGLPLAPGEGVLALSRALRAVVSETNYGRVFDVKAVAGGANNGAFTAAPLAPHTDNPYRDPVPGFQALACVVPAAEGGATTFADGAALYGLMAAEQPALAAALAQTRALFAWADAGNAHAAARFVFELFYDGVDGGSDGGPRPPRLAAVHLNDRALRGPACAPAESTEWFDALGALLARLDAGECSVAVRLAAGEGVVWDNRRMLHGRQPYADAPGAPARWLQGLYLTRDSVLGPWAAERVGEGGDEGEGEGVAGGACAGARVGGGA